MIRRVLIAAAAIAACLACAQAEDSPSDAQIAFEKAYKVATQGPADIVLRELAALHLSDEYLFVPALEGSAVMHALGNHTDERFVGLIFPKAQNQYWFVRVDYNDSGHVDDEDAKSWDADELLQSIKEGTEAVNEEWAKQGIPQLDVVGWAEKPSYDETTHRLVWSMLARTRGAPPEESATINYNTYALGREGYFELNLITDEQAIASDKRHAGTLIAALDYKPGQTYGDYNRGTDRVAEYGLAALVGGIAAKKLGLLALAAAFFAKFAKIILIGLAVAGGAVFKLFRRKSPEQPTE
jgi:uncharacterized membrane-anchored protein